MVGVHWIPPSPPPEFAFGGSLQGGNPATHFMVEFEWPGYGTVIAETAEGLWLQKGSYYTRTRAKPYVAYTPKQITDVLGADRWEAAPVEQQIRTFERFELELKLSHRDYLRRMRLLSQYHYPASLEWLEIYRLARRVGIERQVGTSARRLAS